MPPSGWLSTGERHPRRLGSWKPGIRVSAGPGSLGDSVDSSLASSGVGAGRQSVLGVPGLATASLPSLRPWSRGVLLVCFCLCVQTSPSL